MNIPYPIVTWKKILATLCLDAMTDTRKLLSLATTGATCGPDFSSHSLLSRGTDFVPRGDGCVVIARTVIYVGLVALTSLNVSNFMP